MSVEETLECGLLSTFTMKSGDNVPSSPSRGLAQLVPASVVAAFVTLALGACDGGMGPERDAAPDTAPDAVVDVGPDTDDAHDGATQDRPSTDLPLFDGSPDILDARDAPADVVVDAPNVDGADALEVGPDADAAVSCSPLVITQLHAAAFAFGGEQNVSGISRTLGGPSPLCSTGRTAASIETQVRLGLRDGAWYAWYEGPYRSLAIPADGTPLVAGTTSSPHMPASGPGGAQGIPLRIESETADTVVFREAPAAVAIPATPAPIPLCTPYLFGPFGLGHGLSMGSEFRLTVSLRTGAMTLVHNCFVRAAVSGCPQPSLADVTTGGGHLICPAALH
ncbi:MAG TPA: hypothetical protein VGG33_03645 [Polyangia bacterium]